MRTALITGGARGIGRAIAERLLIDGHRVAITWAADATSAEETVAALAATGPITAHALDLRDADACTALAATLGPIDVLVNNAAVVKDQVVRFTSDADWLDTLTVDLTGPWRLSEAVLPGMTARGFGRIVHLGSYVGLAGAEGRSAYAAAKAGLSGLTRAQARAAGPAGVTVNAVCPGLVETERTRRYRPAVWERAVAEIPLGRAGAPAEVAGLVGFLVSEAAGYLTGQVLPIDGGLFMREWSEA